MRPTVFSRGNARIRSISALPRPDWRRTGLVKGAIGIGALLADGIGDTIRVSLSDDVTEEVEAGKSILRALGLSGGINLISCPTCGRCRTGT